MNIKSIEALSPQVFYILLALAVKELHGYEIMKQVSFDSHGSINMGPGTLYGAIKRLLKDGWVVETGDKAVSEKQNERRKYYSLTEQGKTHLSAEIQRYQNTLAVVKKKNLLVSVYTS